MKRAVVTAALRRVVRHALTPREANGMGLHRVAIRHARGNEGSRRAIEANGGVVVEEGTPADLFGAPKNERLQDFLSKVL